MQVEITSTTWRDWDTGQESDFTDANCGAFYYDGASTATSYPTCVLGGESGETVAASTNATTGCKNALASICYTVSTWGGSPDVEVSDGVVKGCMERTKKVVYVSSI